MGTFQQAFDWGPPLAALTAIIHAVYTLALKVGCSPDRKDYLQTPVLLFWLNLFVGLLSLTFIGIAQVSIFTVWPYIISASLCYFIGMACMVKGLELGDASVAGPLLGTKVLFTAFASLLIAGEELSPNVWTGMLLVLPGVFLVSYSDRNTHLFGKFFQASSLLSIGAAFLYAVTDGIYRKAFLIYGDRMGMFIYVNLGTALLSMLLLPYLIKFKPWRQLVISWRKFSIIAVLNSVMLTSSILALTMKSNIVITNVVYSSRSVIIIPLALLAERLFRTKIDDLTARVFWIRLSGSILILISIGVCLL